MRDIDAALGADGVPHANLTALALAASAFDGWSASVKVLDEGLRRAAKSRPKGLAVWVVDDEPMLRYHEISHGPRSPYALRPGARVR